MDDLAPDFAALATEAHRLEPRLVAVSTRTSEDYKTVPIIETAGLTAPEVGLRDLRLESVPGRWYL